MSQHLTLPEEQEGIQAAWQNLASVEAEIAVGGRDVRIERFAAYVYDRCTVYTGANHQLWATRMIEAALKAVQGPSPISSETQFRLSEADEAVRAAGIEEDRARARVADLSEMLGVIRAEGSDLSTKETNKLKLQIAYELSTALKEFVDGFHSRLSAALASQVEEAPPA